MLIKLELLDDFKERKAKLLYDTLTSVHGNMSDLLWMAMIADNFDDFAALCRTDSISMLTSFEHDEDFQSLFVMDQTINSPLYVCGLELFHEAHDDLFRYHVRNYVDERRHSFLPYRVTEYEKTADELVIELEHKHASRSTEVRGSGRSRRVAHPWLHYTHGTTR